MQKLEKFAMSNDNFISTVQNKIRPSEELIKLNEDIDKPLLKHEKRDTGQNLKATKKPPRENKENKEGKETKENLIKNERYINYNEKDDNITNPNNTNNTNNNSYIKKPKENNHNHNESIKNIMKNNSKDKTLSKHYQNNTLEIDSNNWNSEIILKNQYRSIEDLCYDKYTSRNEYIKKKTYIYLFKII